MNQESILLKFSMPCVNNGKVNGVTELEGITEVGFRIEESIIKIRVNG